MTIQNEFMAMAKDQLPSAPGIIMVCCPEGKNAKSAKVIALVPAENVREKVIARSVAWATECSTGYLEYFVAQVSDPATGAALLENATSLMPPGTVIAKP